VSQPRRRAASNVVPTRAHIAESASASIEQFLVAIPARNEQDTIAACIESIDAAASAVVWPVHLVIAVDCCTDATGHLAAQVPVQHCTRAVVSGTWAGAGAARRAAVTHGLSLIGSERRLRRVWIANTDADTIVPPDWLATQLRYSTMCQAVAGIVDLDPTQVPTSILHRFRTTYHRRADSHDHVHGANLGVRATSYLAAGGWCPATRVGEDHGLWQRLVETGATVHHSIQLRVATSGRVVSRVEGGFATNLRTLALGQEPREGADCDTVDPPRDEGFSTVGGDELVA
jgi:glycosyltransferase involved in cell wall biosynthesis